MRRTSSAQSLSSYSGSQSSLAEQYETYLSYQDKEWEARPRRGRSLLRVFSYRKIVRWTLTSILLVSIILLQVSGKYTVQVVPVQSSPATSDRPATFHDAEAVEDPVGQSVLEVLPFSKTTHNKEPFEESEDGEEAMEGGGDGGEEGEKVGEGEMQEEGQEQGPEEAEQGEEIEELQEMAEEQGEAEGEQEEGEEGQEAEEEHEQGGKEEEEQGEGRGKGEGEENEEVEEQGEGNPEEKGAKEGKEDGDEEAETIDEDELSRKQDEEDRQKAEEAIKHMPWLRFPHLNGYFNGLLTLVKKSDHIAEYPNPSQEAPITQMPPLRDELPKPRPYDPYPSDASIRPCFLDAENKIPAPSVYAYEGVPQHMPDAAIGSHQLLGMRDDVCFDRFGRYGPYGLGYSETNGGSGVGLGESAGSEAVWAESGQINYNVIDWGEVQTRCSARNQGRFSEAKAEKDANSQSEKKQEEEEEKKKKKKRTAVVIRLYTGFAWTQLAVVNFRALITELSLKSGSEYEVHFLMHVRENQIPVWADDATARRLLDRSVPREFHGLVTLWSEAQMRIVYPGRFDEPLSNPSGANVHGVYRSAHLPLQLFAAKHPEYDHFWNWEMDMRLVGSYYELLDRIGSWAEAQPRRHLWERSARYYIPSQHGSWDNFSSLVDRQVSPESAVLGPVDFEGKKALRGELDVSREDNIFPEPCGDGDESCGVGEAADIITFNPIFDAVSSGWVFANDVTGYPRSAPPPRRCAIVTASRMSRRLLLAMHEEVWHHHHTMFTEMFPASVALHHGFKAVYAPHPIFLERAWTPLGSALDEALNAGAGGSTSGPGSPFDPGNEHNHRGTTWYFNSQFAGRLWGRWLGHAQMDGGGTGPERLKGGEGSSGRMCLRSMLLHPIKHEGGS